MVPFLGACVDAGNVCILAPYCSRGSLEDVLENDDYKLDTMFIASLVADLLKVRRRFAFVFFASKKCIHNSRRGDEFRACVGTDRESHTWAPARGGRDTFGSDSVAAVAF